MQTDDATNLLDGRRVVIQLAGLDGNAFFVIGAWRRAARAQGIPADGIARVIDEAMSGDYNHLLATFIAHSAPPEE